MRSTAALALVHTAPAAKRLADPVFAAVRLHRSLLEKLQDAQEAVEACEEKVVLELHGPQPELPPNECWKEPRADFDGIPPIGLPVPRGFWVRDEKGAAKAVDTLLDELMPHLKDDPAERKKYRDGNIAEMLKQIAAEKARHEAAWAKHGLNDAKALAKSLRTEERNAFAALRKTLPTTVDGYAALLKHCTYISDWHIFEGHYGFESKDFLKLLSAALKNLSAK